MKVRVKQRLDGGFSPDFLVWPGLTLRLEDFELLNQDMLEQDGIF